MYSDRTPQKKERDYIQFMLKPPWRLVYQLSWKHCTNLDELRQKLKHVLDSISPEAIASRE
ncbi:MAG: hypothetical protein V7K46_23555 [Nostoc sp.]